MLRAKGIHKYYGHLHVLKGVDISIKRGEIVSIVGSSGAGKSTLLHILGTLDKADSGYIELEGVRIENLTNKELVPVSWSRRALNSIIDSIVITLLTLLFLKIFNFQYESLFAGTFALTYILLPVIIPFVYYTLFESFNGKTIGKYITQTKVAIADDATKPKILNCALRTLARFIPFEVISFFSKRPIGWHDSISRTIIIDSNIPYQKSSTGRLTNKQLSIFRNKHMGFVFQFHHLLPEFTALENVCIPGWVAGRRKKEVESEALKLLQLLGLGERLDNKPNELSGGEQQRVAVARSLINKPSIVFADEPTGNLDSKNAKELHDLFIQLRKQFNQTFLIVTHNEELAQMSDRVLYMRDGLIISENKE